MRTVIAIAVAVAISMVGNTGYYALTADGHRLPFTSDEPIFGLLVLSHLVMAVFLAVAIRWVSAYRPTTWQNGALIGAFLGAVMFLPIGLIVRAAWNVPVTLYFASDFVLAVAINAVMGAVIAAIIPFEKPHASPA